jgi:hypothetical protein
MHWSKTIVQKDSDEAEFDRMTAWLLGAAEITRRCGLPRAIQARPPDVPNK